MEFRILGTLEAVDGDVSLPLGGRRQRMVMATLLLHANQVVSTDRLIDDVWGDEPPAAARKSLQAYISRLNGVLGDNLIESAASGYALRVNLQQTDAGVFESLVREARSARNTDPHRSAELLTRALKLWHGVAWGDLGDAHALVADSERLEELRLAALEDRIEADLELGRSSAVVGELQSLVAAHPLRERLRAHLMLALYREGRQADALAVYQDARSLLGEELGIDPSPGLQNLEERILLHDETLDAPPTSPNIGQAGPQAASAEASQSPRTNLPHAHTSFVGRLQELAELDKLVVGARMVTVTGIGGVGKSRLATEVGAGVLDRLADGVWHVQLASVLEGSVVPARVAAALDLGPYERRGLAPLDEIADRLRNTSALVILDDCERFLTDAADVAQTILSASPHTRVLATSRESLGLAGEVVYPVDPLAIPSEPLDIAALGRLDSVQLFLQRAEAAHPGFRLTDATAPHVARLCRRLEGVPLALELAAARLRMVSLEELVARIDDNAALLEPGRGTKTRQRTLMSVLDGSHELLSEVEARVFRRTGLFLGGFRPELAADVCQVGTVADLTDILFDLVDQSLLSVDPESSRFSMLDFVRLYAERRLAEDDAKGEVERRFALTYTRWMADVTGFRADPSHAWLTTIEAEHENILRALRWLVEHSLREPATLICSGMGKYWRLRGQPSEGRLWCEQVLSLTGEVESALIHRTLRSLGELAALQGDLDAGVTHLQAALDVARGVDDGVLVAETLAALAGLEHKRGDPQAAMRLFEESLEISRDSGESAQQIHIIASLALLAEDGGALERAHALGEEALDVARASDDPYALADALLTSGELAINRRDIERARSDLTEALDVAERTGLEEVRGWALTYLGQVMRLGSDLNGALERQRQGWEVFSAIDAAAGQAWALRQMALTEIDLNRLDDAGTHLQMALGIADRSVRADVPVVLEAVVRLQIERGALDAAATTAGAVGRWRAELGLRPSRADSEAIEASLADLEEQLGDRWAGLAQQGRSADLSELAASI